MELGSNIRNIRKQHGLRQEQLAEAMGVSIASVSKWENGKSMPDSSIMLDFSSLSRVNTSISFSLVNALTFVSYNFAGRVNANVISAAAPPILDNLNTLFLAPALMKQLPIPAAVAPTNALPPNEPQIANPFSVPLLIGFSYSFLSFDVKCGFGQHLLSIAEIFIIYTPFFSLSLIIHVKIFFASKFTLCKRILKKSIFVLVYEHKRRRLL